MKSDQNSPERVSGELTNQQELWTSQALNIMNQYQEENNEPDKLEKGTGIENSDVVNMMIL